MSSFSAKLKLSSPPLFLKLSTLTLFIISHLSLLLVLLAVFFLLGLTTLVLTSLWQTTTSSILQSPLILILLLGTSLVVIVLVTMLVKLCSGTTSLASIPLSLALGCSLETLTALPLNLKKTGRNPFASSSSHNLTTELDNLSLIDLGFIGHPFTWSNKRTDDENIQQRIYRGVANSDWPSLYPHTTIHHLPVIGSDHNPLLLNTSTDNNHPKPFRFELMWLDDKTCYNTVHTSWNKPVFGSPPFKLHSKIKNVKKALNIWNTTQFGNCHKKF